MATRQEFESAVTAYLQENHLDFCERWFDFAHQSAAVGMAFGDIQSRFPGCPELEKIAVGSALFKAVAEQAIYLAANYDAFRTGQVLSSEALDGASASYANVSGDISFSFRAAQLLKQAKRDLFGATAPIRRG